MYKKNNFICREYECYLPSLKVYRGLLIFTRFISLSQWIVGGGFPEARHCITAEWPISITRVFGLCVITGNPSGVLSAGIKMNEKKTQHYYYYFCSLQTEKENLKYVCVFLCSLEFCTKCSYVRNAKNRIGRHKWLENKIWLNFIAAICKRIER